MRALSIAATGMAAQQTNVEVIANNLANMNTTGYKSQIAEFEDLLYQNVEQPGAQSSDSNTLIPNGIQLGAGVRTAAVARVVTQGDADADVESLRSCDPGLRLFPRHHAGRDLFLSRDRAISRSRPLGEIVTQDGYAVAPGISVPSNAHRHPGQCARPGAVAQIPGQSLAADAGPARARQFSQCRRPHRHRQQPLHSETPSSGCPAGRRARLAPATAPSRKAISKPPMSIRWRRSPRSSPRSVPTR